MEEEKKAPLFEETINSERNSEQQTETNPEREAQKTAKKKENRETAQEAQPQKKRGKFRTWWDNHKPTKRRIIQLYAALLTNANIKGFATGRIYDGKTKYVCTPGLNCYSCPGAVGACPLGSLQNALAQSGTRLPFYILGILVLFGLLLGRTICGFLCPFGLAQEITYKLPTPKLQKSRFTRVLSYLKYVILIVFVIAIPTIYGAYAQMAIPGFCKYICPAGTLGGAVALLANAANADMFSMLHGLFTWKFCLMIAIVLSSVFIYRSFCRFLCPLGAIYGFFNKVALIGIKLDKNKCTDCGLCVAHCKMDIKKVGDHECINCGECIDICPAKAISWKGSKFFLHENAVSPIPAPETEAKPLGSLLKNGTAPSMAAEPQSAAADSPVTAAPVTQSPVMAAPVTESSVADAPVTEKNGETGAETARKRRGRGFWLELAAWIAALAVLVGALVYFNACDVEEQTGGSEIGEECYDFTLPCYLKEGSWTLSEQRGKIVIINFWATWCGPCVGELPSFEQIQEEYGDAISVVAVHSASITEDVLNFLQTKTDINDETRTWSDWSLTFVQDSGDDIKSETFNKLGGKDSYPMTVIVDADGVIRFKREGSMTYKTLSDNIRLLLLSSQN